TYTYCEEDGKNHPGLFETGIRTIWYVHASGFGTQALKYQKKGHGGMKCLILF
ncbi:hypothetical protein LCGC14_3132460, partial [marine sediment metagenome]